MRYSFILNVLCQAKLIGGEGYNDKLKMFFGNKPRCPCIVETEEKIKPTGRNGPKISGHLHAYEYQSNHFSCFAHSYSFQVEPFCSSLFLYLMVTSDDSVPSQSTVFRFFSDWLYKSLWRYIYLANPIKSHSI